MRINSTTQPPETQQAISLLPEKLNRRSLSALKRYQAQQGIRVSEGCGNE